MSSPPPPNFYQSRQAYWGNPYALADSDDDSDHSDDVPLAVDVRAAAIDASTSVANVSAVVACMSAATVDVSASTVDLCPFDSAIADVSAAVVDASAYFAVLIGILFPLLVTIAMKSISLLHASLSFLSGSCKILWQKRGQLSSHP